MKAKRIWSIIYIIFIAALTYIVATFSEAEKVNQFLSDHREEFENNEKALIMGSVIANEHNATEGYILNDPLFSETYQSTSHEVAVSIYPLVQFKKDKGQNSIAILLTNIKIENDRAVLDDHDLNKLNIQLEFDRDLGIGDGKQSIFKEPMTTLYDNTGRLMIINHDLLETPSGLAILKRISFSYELDTNFDQTLVELTNSNLVDLAYTDIFDGYYHRDINLLTEENLDLISQYGLTNIKSKPEIYYPEELIASFSTYNSVFIKYIGIELLIVLPLTYFLFFHKLVKLYIKAKKETHIK